VQQPWCGALPAELSADLGKRSGGELLDDVHGHLAGISDRPALLLRTFKVLPHAKLKVLAHALLDQVDSDALFPGKQMMFRSTCWRGPQRNRQPPSARHMPIRPRQRAFQASRHVGLDGPAAMYSATSSGRLKWSISAFFLQNSDLGLQVRRLDIRD